MGTRFQFTKVSTKYGAPMGRPSVGLEDPAIHVTLNLQRVPMVDGDYDPGGAYWGGGRDVPPLWVAFNGAGLDVVHFVRGWNRVAAKQAVKKAFPNARFFV